MEYSLILKGMRPEGLPKYCLIWYTSISGRKTCFTGKTGFTLDILVYQVDLLVLPVKQVLQGVKPVLLVKQVDQFDILVYQV